MSVAAALQYQTVYERIRQAAALQAALLWDRLGGLDDTSAEKYATAAARTVTGAQTAAVQLVAGYLTIAARGEGATVRQSAIDFKSLPMRGVDPFEVYLRPTVTARTAISDGKTFDQAMQLARIRAGVLAQTDVAIAQRAGTVATLKSIPHAVGYRRVLTGSSCPLCATASTQRYHKAQLAPIHPRCDCSVAPIIGNSDPGQIINSKLLAELKAKSAAEGVLRSDAHVAAQKTLSQADSRIREIRAQLPDETDPARRARLEDRLAAFEQRRSKASATVADLAAHTPDEIAVHMHGELGPVLTVKGQHFDGPSVVG